MKKLTRLKLINWHRFSDVTIDFGDSTLISGENGAGKSTLLDAIQFVVTCSTNHFNKAAHENGKRKLTGYIRCKTGRENHPYERTGEITPAPRIILIDDKGTSYTCVSIGVYNSLRNIVMDLWLPSEEEPIVIIPRRVKGKNRYEFTSLEVSE